MTPRWILLLLSLSLVACAGAPVGAEYVQRNDVSAFIDEMHERHGFERGQLETWFKDVRVRDDIIAAISRPAESKPWHQYRPIFLQNARIEGGLEFWREHAADLKRAEEQYGVPPQIVIAILGVETRYGRQQGNYRVLDALTTLAFDYPPRAKFFRGELEQYLLLAREEGIDPLALKGSYAGAMGQAQFISSSFRNYAVDFDGDGKRDLWNSPSDAIGSIANYFKVHGWEWHGLVAVPATVSGEHYPALLEAGLKPSLTWAEIKQRGVETPVTLLDQLPVALIALEQEAGPEYWLGLQNFYVITRYNRSPLYAMAVYQLSEEIRRLRERQSADREAK
ncbi:MAG: lytic murein transglycosylase B [Pseudomonadota bacterium]